MKLSDSNLFEGHDSVGRTPCPECSSVPMRADIIDRKVLDARASADNGLYIRVGCEDGFNMCYYAKSNLVHLDYLEQIANMVNERFGQATLREVENWEFPEADFDV